MPEQDPYIENHLLADGWCTHIEEALPSDGRVFGEVWVLEHPSAGRPTLQNTTKTNVRGRQSKIFHQQAVNSVATAQATILSNTQ